MHSIDDRDSAYSRGGVGPGVYPQGTRVDQGAVGGDHRDPGRGDGVV